jgi:hypothetical protein
MHTRVSIRTQGLGTKHLQEESPWYNQSRRDSHTHTDVVDADLQFNTRLSISQATTRIVHVSTAMASSQLPTGNNAEAAEELIAAIGTLHLGEKYNPTPDGEAFAAGHTLTNRSGPMTSLLQAEPAARQVTLGADAGSQSPVTLGQAASQRLEHAFSSGEELRRSWDAKDAKSEYTLSRNAHAYEKVPTKLQELLDATPDQHEAEGKKSPIEDLKHTIQVLCQQRSALERDGAEALQNWVEYMHRCVGLQDQLNESNKSRRKLTKENTQLRQMLSAIQRQLDYR